VVGNQWYPGNTDHRILITEKLSGSPRDAR
jgi:hypothetical protein